MINVAFIFHSTSNDNLGVGALSVSELVILRKISSDRGIPVQVTFLTGDEKRPSYISGSDVRVHIIRPLRRPLKFFSEIRKADLVIDIGGGDSFADIYGPRRIGQMYLMKFLSHLAKRPLILAPQTIGPFKHWWSRFLALQTLKLSSLVSTRDKASLDQIRDLGFIGEVVEASDVALRLPFMAEVKSSEDTFVKVGINVSGLLMNGGYSKDNMFGLSLDYSDFIRKLLIHFSQEHMKCEVHLIPHVISWERGGIEDDYAASIELAEHFPGIKVAPAFETPSEAKSYISGMDFFVGARMHACIAAFSTGVPVVPIAYSRKFSGLFGSLGYNQTVDCTSVTLDAAISLILEAFERRNELAISQKHAFELGIARLERYELALGDFLETLAESN